MSQPSFRDVEQLNAYLDGELDPTQRQRLESRLGTDPELKSILDELREARMVLRRLPQRRAPRNFTLTPKMAGVKPPLPRAYPVFRFASAFAAILLFLSYTSNYLPRFSMPMGAAAPAAMEMQTGVGGGEPEDQQRNQSGGGCDSCTVEATTVVEVPAAPSEKMPPAPDATTAPAEEMQTFQQDQIGEAESALEESKSTSPFPAMSNLQVALLVTAFLTGLVALIIRWKTDSAFTKRNKGG
jgi:hypothetical protein